MIIHVINQVMLIKQSFYQLTLIFIMINFIFIIIICFYDCCYFRYVNMFIMILYFYFILLGLYGFWFESVIDIDGGIGLFCCNLVMLVYQLFIEILICIGYVGRLSSYNFDERNQQESVYFYYYCYYSFYYCDYCCYYYCWYLFLIKTPKY